jgi:iron complex outermembrane receptor protein
LQVLLPLLPLHLLEQQSLFTVQLAPTCDGVQSRLNAGGGYTGAMLKIIKLPESNNGYTPPPSILWLTVAILLLLYPMMTAAQESESTDPVSKAPVSKKKPAEIVVDEIVVTARLREERLEDVPVSISALTADELSDTRVENATDLLGRVPGLAMSSNIISAGRDLTFLTLRGVGADAQIEPSTAIYLDGVYLPNLAFDMAFLDLERVEVLRGPQGALFGRNAQAGAINLITRTPSAHFVGRLGAEIDDFESYKGRASLSGPLSDRVSAGFSGQYYDTEGFVTNEHFGVPADEHSEWAARMTLKATLSESWELLLRADGLENSGHGYTPGVLAGCDCYEVSSEIREPFAARAEGASLHLEGLFQDIQVTSVIAWRDLENSQPFDHDGTDIYLGNYHNLTMAQDIFSQELRFSSTRGDKFSWLAGLYGFDDSISTDRNLFLPDLDTFLAGFTVRQIAITERRGGAVFGQANWRFTERTELTLGSRYSRQNVDNFSSDYGIIPLIGFEAGFTLDSEVTFEDFSPMASFLVQWTPHLMTYATVAQGFKAGGFDILPGIEATVLPVDSETTINFEIGFKASTPGRHASVSGAVFRVNIKDQQLQSVLLVDEIPYSALVNAGRSHTQGLELELSVRPTQAFNFHLSAGYTETEFEEYVDGAGVDRAGEPFAYTPKLTASLRADYTIPVRGDSAIVRAFAQLRHVGDYFIGTGAAFNPRFDLDSYELVDLALAYEADKWSLTLFADNLLDDYIPVRTWNVAGFANDAHYLDTVLAPRRVGLRLDYRF